jgi:hypothetical protein
VTVDAKERERERKRKRESFDENDVSRILVLKSSLRGRVMD